MRRDLESGNLSIIDLATGKIKSIDFRSSIFELVNNVRNSLRFSIGGGDRGPGEKLSTPTTLEAAGKRKLSAVEVLVSRLIWYPVVLIIVEIFRGIDRSGSSVSFPLHLLHLLTNSLQGTAYFIIFLSMQPRAYTIFINIITFAYYKNYKEESSLSSQEQRPARSFQVSWGHDDQYNNDNDNNINNNDIRQSASSVIIMNEMNEDDLVEQVQSNNDLIEDAIRSSIISSSSSTPGSIRNTDISIQSSFMEARPSSSIVALNAIRIADINSDINL